ncbi:MAG TPA: hypothetical protein DEV74_02400 [Acidovorax sp.]|nr:hypothetical protein [Acidovorax sp.]
MNSWSSTSLVATSVHPPEALRAFPLLSNRCAIREGGRPQRGGAALARGRWSGKASLRRLCALAHTKKGL